jgi:hypothetical protein
MSLLKLICQSIGVILVIGIILIQGLRWFLMELRLLFGSMHSQAGAWERGKHTINCGKRVAILKSFLLLE